MSAKDYVQDIRALTSEQYTLPRTGVLVDHILFVTYERLNDAGENLYKTILERAVANNFDGNLFHAHYIHTKSGYELTDPCKIECYRNIVVKGDIGENHEKIELPVLFYAPQWCYTQSGLLYKIV